MAKRVIGLTGKKGSGKDTAAKSLIGVGYTRVYFAEALKEMVRVYLMYEGASALECVRLMVDKLQEVAGTKYPQSYRTFLELRLYEWGQVHVGGGFWTGGGYKQPVTALDAVLMIDGEWKEARITELNNCTPRSIMQTIGTEWGRKMIGDNFWTSIIELKVRAIKGDVVITDVRFDNEAKLVHELDGIVVDVQRPSTANAGDKHASEAGVNPDLIDYIIDNSGDLKCLHDTAISLTSVDFTQPRLPEL